MNDAWSTTNTWYQAWRKHVACAKAYPQNEGYCRAAMIANAQYVCALAFEMNEGRS